MPRSSHVLSDAVVAMSAVLFAFFVSAWIAPARAQDKPEALRAEVGRPLSAAQDLLKAQKFADALAKLQEADAVGAKTPYES